MARLIEVGSVILDADEVVSVEDSVQDSVQVQRTNWYCGYKRNCVKVTFKSGNTVTYHSFTKKDFIDALKG